MPRCGQMSLSAKTDPSRVRPNSNGSPKSVFGRIRPGARSVPGRAKYHISRKGAGPLSSTGFSAIGRRRE